MSRRTPWCVGVALAALLSAAACGLIPPRQQPTATPSETPAATASPGPVVPRELAASPTVFDVEACAALTEQWLANMPYEIGLDQLRDIYRLVLYHVGSDGLSDPEYGFAPQDLQDDQADTARHAEIWSLVARLFPDEERQRIRYLLIYTDGEGESLASVAQSGSPYYWRLAVDIEDAGNTDVLSISLIHELGHLVTLNESQVTPDLNLFNHPDDRAAYRQAQAKCGTYFTAVGCSRGTSYINLFFKRFWPDLYDAWLAVVSGTGTSSYSTGLQRIYNAHRQDFVTEYAVSSPDEDIAESFRYFVLSPKPAGDTVADQKVRFFYGFSALVRMRAGILQNICTPAAQP